MKKKPRGYCSNTRIHSPANRMKRFFRNIKREKDGRVAQGTHEPPAPSSMPPPPIGTPDLDEFQPTSLEQRETSNSTYDNSIYDYSLYTNSNHAGDYEVVESKVLRDQTTGKRVTQTTVRVEAADPVTQARQAAEATAAATAKLTRDLVKKFVADIWNRGEIDLIPEVCSPSIRFNGNNGFDRVGHDGFARMVSIVREALDDYHVEIHSMVVENNKAFCRLRFTGKHVG